MGNDLENIESLFVDVEKDTNELKVLLFRLNENITRLSYNTNMLNQYDGYDDLDIFSVYKMQTTIRNIILNFGSVEPCFSSFKMSLNSVKQEIEQAEENKKDNNV